MRFLRSIAFRLLFALSLIGSFPCVSSADELSDISSYLLNDQSWVLSNIDGYIQYISTYISSIAFDVYELRNAIGYFDFESQLSILSILSAYYNEIGPTVTKSILEDILDKVSNTYYYMSDIGYRIDISNSWLSEIDNRLVEFIDEFDLQKALVSSIENTLQGVAPSIVENKEYTILIHEILANVASMMSAYFNSSESQFEALNGHADAIVMENAFMGEAVANIQNYVYELQADFNRFTDHYLEPERVTQRDYLYYKLYHAVLSPYSYQYKSAPLTVDGSPAIVTNGGFVLENRDLQGDDFFTYVANGLRLQLEQQANANNYLYNILAQIQSVEKNQEEIDSAVASANAEAQTMQSEYESVSTNSPSSALTFDGLHRTYTSPSFDPSPNLPSELYFELPGVPPFIQSTTEVHIPISQIRGFIDNVRSCFTFIWWLLVVLIHVSCYALVVKFIKWVIAFYGNMTLTPH